MEGAADIGQGVMSGAALGATDLAGLPGTLRDLTGMASDPIARGVVGAVTLGQGNRPQRASDAEVADIYASRRTNPLGIPRIPNPIEYFPSGQQVADFVRRNVGMPAQPKGSVGRMVEGGVRAIPTGVALGGPAGAIPSLVGGTASEAAGQATAGTPYEGAARFGAGVVGGVTAAQMQRPAYAERLAGNAVRGLDDATTQRARALMADAQARGISLTIDEALQAASGGAHQPLTNLRRVVDQSAEGGRAMSQAMAQRVPAVEAAARRSIGGIAPDIPDPSAVGPRIAETARRSLDGARQTGNRLAQPYYDALPGQRLLGADARALMSDPVYGSTLAEIRRNPELNRTIANLPDDSVAVVNEVVKRMQRGVQEARGNATTVADPQLAASRQMGITGGTVPGRNGPQQITGADTVARQASPEYGMARAVEEEWRRRAVAPLEAGPLGRMQPPDTGLRSTQEAAQALLPANPVAGSQGEVARAVSLLTRTPQGAADTRQLVRQSVEMPANARFGNTVQGAPDQFAGARYANDIQGNTQAARNTDAAMRGAAGPQVADDYARTLDVLAATGARPSPGSMTTFNAQLQQDMREPNLAVRAATGPLRTVRDMYERARLGSTSEALAALLLQGDKGLNRMSDLARSETTRQMLVRMLLTQSASDPAQVGAP